MPIISQNIEEHREMYDIQEANVMSIVEYRYESSGGAFFWTEHHEFIRSALSEIFFQRIKNN